MNKRQKVALWVGVAVAGLMLIYTTIVENMDA